MGSRENGQFVKTEVFPKDVGKKEVKLSEEETQEVPVVLAPGLVLVLEGEDDETQEVEVVEESSHPGLKHDSIKWY